MTGGKTLCIPKDKIPLRPRPYVLVPEDVGELAESLDLIRISNDDLPVDSRRVVKVCESKNGFMEAIVISITSSFVFLSLGCIYHGFGKKYLKVYKADKVIKARSIVVVAA